MKKYRIYQVNSFTQECFRGNPAGVVLNAQGLTEEQMRQIARELNNSETAFVFPPEDEDHDVVIRFFTPKTEVPICGHATIAVHYVRAAVGEIGPGRTIQKTKAGIFPVDVTLQGGGYAVTMTQGKPEIGPPLKIEVVEQIAAALGISVEDIRADCPVSIASTGHAKVMVGITSTELLHHLTPDMGKLSALGSEIGCNGYYVFTLNPQEDYFVHGRMFSPAIGAAEDPVTGNANGPLGAYMVHYNICQDKTQLDSFDFDIIQGEAIGRAGTMHVHIKKQNGAPISAQITGTAVIVFSTEIALP